MKTETPAATATRYLVIRIDLNGKRVPSRVRRSLSAAREQAAATQTAHPASAVSIVTLLVPARVSAQVELAFRVERVGPGAGGKVYGVYAARGLADHIAHLAAAKYRSATVTVTPVRKAA